MSIFHKLFDWYHGSKKEEDQKRSLKFTEVIPLQRDMLEPEYTPKNLERKDIEIQVGPGLCGLKTVSSGLDTFSEPVDPIPLKQFLDPSYKPISSSRTLTNVQTSKEKDANTFQFNTNKSDSNPFQSGSKKTDTSTFQFNTHKSDSNSFQSGSNKTETNTFQFNTNKSNTNTFQFNSDKPVLSFSFTSPENKSNEKKFNLPSLPNSSALQSFISK